MVGSAPAVPPPQDLPAARPCYLNFPFERPSNFCEPVSLEPGPLHSSSPSRASQTRLTSCLNPPTAPIPRVPASRPAFTTANQTPERAPSRNTACSHPPPTLDAPATLVSYSCLAKRVPRVLARADSVCALASPPPSALEPPLFFYPTSPLAAIGGAVPAVAALSEKPQQPGASARTVHPPKRPASTATSRSRPNPAKEGRGLLCSALA